MRWVPAGVGGVARRGVGCLPVGWGGVGWPWVGCGFGWWPLAPRALDAAEGAPGRRVGMRPAATPLHPRSLPSSCCLPATPACMPPVLDHTSAPHPRGPPYAPTPPHTHPLRVPPLPAVDHRGCGLAQPLHARPRRRLHGRQLLIHRTPRLPQVGPPVRTPRRQPSAAAACAPCVLLVPAQGRGPRRRARAFSGSPRREPPAAPCLAALPVLPQQHVRAKWPAITVSPPTSLPSHSPQL